MAHSKIYRFGIGHVGNFSGDNNKIMNLTVYNLTIGYNVMPTLNFTYHLKANNTNQHSYNFTLEHSGSTLFI
uniref:Uncharacterized protein n=1 Tax=Acrobeloides nanus TaxID=290746 RepID=A0A914BZ68_9BILA